MSTADASTERSSCCAAAVTYLDDQLVCKACHASLVWAV